MDPYSASPQPTAPPATPAPQPGAFPSYGPAQVPQPSAQPYPQPPQPTAPYPPQPQPAAHYSPLGAASAPQPSNTPPTSWYTPPPAQSSTKPGDVDTYLRASGATPPASGATGQTINGQYSIDYLDQLAGPTRQGLDKKFIFIGIGAALALLAAAALLFASPQASVSTKSEISLYTTMVDIEASTRQSNRHIKNSQLSAINSNLRTSLTNASRDMTQPLSSMGQDPSNLKAAATKAPYHDDKFVSTLEDARLNGVYDRVYANEINTKVLFILTYMESIEKNNSRESMQEFIKNNKSSFTTIQKSIEKYRESPDANLY